MKTYFIFLIIISATFKVQALVGFSDTLDKSKHQISYEYQLEAGKLEPNENKTSFQTAEIKVNKLSYGFGLGDMLYFDKLTLNLDYSQFTSAEERVGSNLFYEADSGYFLNLGVTFEILHEADRLFHCLLS